jgi:hypothetical protein
MLQDEISYGKYTQEKNMDQQFIVPLFVWYLGISLNSVQT